MAIATPDRPSVQPPTPEIKVASPATAAEQPRTMKQRVLNLVTTRFGRKQQQEAPTAEAALRQFSQAAENPQVRQDADLAQQYLRGLVTPEKMLEKGYTDAYLIGLNQQGIVAENSQRQVSEPASNTQTSSTAPDVLAGMRATLNAQPISEPVPLPQFIQDMQSQQELSAQGDGTAATNKTERQKAAVTAAIPGQAAENLRSMAQQAEAGAADVREKAQQAGILPGGEKSIPRAGQLPGELNSDSVSVRHVVDAAKTPVDTAAVRAVETQRDQGMAAFIRDKAGEAQRQTDAILASRQGISGEPAANQGEVDGTQGDARDRSSGENVITKMRADLNAQPISEPVPLPQFIQDMQRQQAEAPSVSHTHVASAEAAILGQGPKNVSGQERTEGPGGQGPQISEPRMGTDTAESAILKGVREPAQQDAVAPVDGGLQPNGVVVGTAGGEGGVASEQGVASASDAELSSTRAAIDARLDRLTQEYPDLSNAFLGVKVGLLDPEFTRNVGDITDDELLEVARQRVSGGFGLKKPEMMEAATRFARERRATRANGQEASPAETQSILNRDGVATEAVHVEAPSGPLAPAEVVSVAGVEIPIPENLKKDSEFLFKLKSEAVKSGEIDIDQAVEVYRAEQQAGDEMTGLFNAWGTTEGSLRPRKLAEGETQPNVDQHEVTQKAFDALTAAEKDPAFDALYQETIHELSARGGGHENRRTLRIETYKKYIGQKKREEMAETRENRTIITLPADLKGDQLLVDVVVNEAVKNGNADVEALVQGRQEKIAEEQAKKAKEAAEAEEARKAKELRDKYGAKAGAWADKIIKKLIDERDLEPKGDDYDYVAITKDPGYQRIYKQVDLEAQALRRDPNQRALTQEALVRYRMEQLQQQEQIAAAGVGTPVISEQAIAGERAEQLSNLTGTLQQEIARRTAEAGTTAAEAPLTPREKAMQKQMNEMMRILKEMAEAKFAEAQTDEDKAKATNWLTALAAIAFGLESVASGVVE